MATRLGLTYEDYLAFPDDGRRHEIIEGEHFMTPSPITRHQRACGNIYALLREHARRSGAGKVFIAPMDVVFSDEDVVQPDVLFISTARAAIITEKNIQGAPDLVVEVLSETTRKTDLSIKRKLYAASGVLEYWVVDPELEAVSVYRAGQAGYDRAAELSLETKDSLKTPLLPGLSLPLCEIFL
ncbi:MAG: Uma2 family endonuclease [Elusimicrobia bacterium]|nr:Uma2 family endonuclease [Elusimicrobiota bacterium]